MEETKEETKDREIKPVSLPKIANPCPYRVNLEPGIEYRYCTCGLSKTQPFCDDSHIGTDFEPLNFKVERKQTLWYLCGCKHNRKSAGPFCDGSHINLQW